MRKLRRRRAMVRFILLILVAILVLGLLTTGFMLAPCQATASNFSANEATPIITNATLSNEETTPSKVAFQASYLSLSLRTDKPVYLTGETIAITVSTSVSNTRVRVLAQLPSGPQETIANFTTSGSYTYSWSTSTPGQVKFTCEGEAIVQVWSTCTRVVCIGKDCWFDTYPCLQSTTVTGNAFYDIRVFSRVTSISGSVIDTNQQPIPKATIYLTGTMQSTTTNNDGFYEFISYQLGNNYTLINQIPTGTETVSAEAIACEPQPGKTVQVQAERGASDVNFTLKRYFYPPAIDLSEFTFDAFSGWEEAKESSAWQNILGITIAGPVKLRKLSFGARELSHKSFDIGDKKLLLVTKPQLGRYFMEVDGNQHTKYSVAAAATQNGSYLKEMKVSGDLGTENTRRVRVVLKQGGIEVAIIKPFSLLLVIIPIIVGIGGGLVAAYFIAGRRVRGPKKAPSGIKWPKMKRPIEGKIQEKAKKKVEVKKEKEPRERPKTKWPKIKWPKMKRATEGKAPEKAKKKAEVKKGKKPRERPNKGKD